jgi:hypothetical protein
MDHVALIAKMRGRIDMCRRLAVTTTDPSTAEVLRQMADEGEQDLRKLQSEHGEIGSIQIRPEA